MNYSQQEKEEGKRISSLSDYQEIASRLSNSFKL
jgi:hypothetical protein